MKNSTKALSSVVLVAGMFSAVPAVLAADTIKIDGSSTVFPISEAAAEEFQAAGKGRVTVGLSGTGGGFKKFCRGETDISDASRPITAAEMKTCQSGGSDGLTVVRGARLTDAGSVEYIELPVAYDALTVVIHPENTWAATMTVEDLKKIWAPEAQGKILKWNQVRPEWPDAPITLYGPGADSGTFEYFTEATVGKAKSSRGDYTASEDDNVLVQGVSQDKNALGYFGYAYYIENKDKLKAVVIDGGKGGVAPSRETVENGTYSPLSRPIFIYVNKKSLTRPEVADFVQFYLKNAPKLVAEVQYVPLPAEAYATGQAHVNAGKIGTVFGGKNEIGITVGELLKRDAKL